MVKNIIKEIIILLLMVLAIILVLGVLLYDYVPNNKIIPEKVSYTTPENVSTELESGSDVDTSEVIVSYQIDATDLTNYKRTKDYVAGKSNPFASTSGNGNTTTDGNTSTSGNTTSGNTNTTGSTGNTGSNTTGGNSQGYLPDKGTK